MKIINKVKEWFTQPPSKSIWFYIAMMLFFGQLTTPVIYYPFLMMGMMSPDADPALMDQTAARVSNETCSKIITPLKTAYVTGQKLAAPNPELGNWIAYTLGSIPLYGLMVAAGYFMQGVLRYFIVWIYQKALPLWRRYVWER